MKNKIISVKLLGLLLVGCSSAAFAGSPTPDINIAYPKPLPGQLDVRTYGASGGTFVNCANGGGAIWTNNISVNPLGNSYWQQSLVWANQQPAICLTATLQQIKQANVGDYASSSAQIIYEAGNTTYSFATSSVSGWAGRGFNYNGSHYSFINCSNASDDQNVIYCCFSTDTTNGCKSGH